MLSIVSLRTLVLCLLLVVLATAAPASEDLEVRASTCNTPSNRACWQTGYTINTDYEASTPPGGSVSYSWEITEHYNWTGPDGFVKSYVQLVNGQYPGPTLRASWGDTISVTIKNSLPVNGTSIHWHGLRQYHTNTMDGANGVTECPLRPGKSKTYTFKATQYGTSWYHSHFSAQYANGVWGTILIDGPASNNYDIDLGVFPINDYYYPTADALTLLTQTGAPPTSDNVLFNGTNINPLDPSKGKYANVTLTPGRRHRLRIINPSVENHFTVSLVGHQFTVLSTDLVPVNSFTTDSLFVAIGQRYDVFFEASQPVDNYWFNVTVGGSTGCGGSQNAHPAAIFHYAGAPANALPTAKGTAPADTGCQDRTNFTPVVPRTANATGFTPSVADTLPVSVNFSQSPVRWLVNGSAINVQWDKPVLEYVIEGNTSYPTSENLVFVDEQNIWTYWVVENATPVPHPMHLHGHDFLVLGNGAGNFTSANFGQLNFKNPVRRDVTMLPSSGWVVLAFMADNPGNWLMHCHIAWHVGNGLSVDFMERRSEQLALISAADKTAYEQVCADWRAYAPSAPPKIDSGLR